MDDLDVPAVSCAEIAAAAGDAEAAFSAAGGKTAVGAADRAPFAKRDLIGFFFGHGLRLRLGWSRWLLRFDFGILALNLDGVGLFLLDFGLRLGDALGFVGENVLSLSGWRRQGNGAD